MSLDSNAFLPIDASGNFLPVADGVAIPASTPGIIFMGSDGTNSRYIKVNSSGQVVSVGAGVAGTPSGGVVSVQGVSGGTVLSASLASVGTNGSSVPASSDQFGISDGTNLQAARGFDLDSGAGTEYNIGVSLRIAGSGGSVAGGTLSNPIRIDPTGTTTQPISAASLPLPTGAATETTLASVLTTTNFQARINTLGQKTMANSTPVVLASDQAAIPVTIGASSTATRTDVASSAASVTLLASNASRKGATIYNDSTKVLYAKFGTTATSSDFTVKMNAGDYYEVPFSFTGRIDGIWSSAQGSARMTELT